MGITDKEKKRAEKLLQNRGVSLYQIKSFSFMKRFPQTSNSSLSAKGKYGPGILTLHMKEGEEVIYLPRFRHPSAVIRFLISQGIPFDNYTPQERMAAMFPVETYRHPSFHMFHFVVLSLMFLILGFYSANGSAWWGFIPAIASFGLSLFFISMLMTRFCYLTLDSDMIVIHSAGRTVRYSYTDLRKVNFDFAREQAFTHVMELLDKDYNYRLFYIGRVPRKKLNEIAELLKQTGIDATCSLNDNKRFYRDIQH